MQMGFMREGKTIDAIFIMRLMLEKYEMAGKRLGIVFVNLERAFASCIPGEVISWELRREDEIEREVFRITEMYKMIKIIKP